MVRRWLLAFLAAIAALPAGAAISEVGSATNSGSGTDISVTHGLSISSGDFVLAVVHRNATSNTIDDNNGSYSFTEALQEVHPCGDSSRYAIFYRIAGSSEPSAYAFTSSSQSWSIIVRVFSGVDNSTPWDVAPSTSTRTCSSSHATADPPSITIGTSGSLGICISGSDTNNGNYSTIDNGYGNEVQETGRAQVSYTRTWSSTGPTGVVQIDMNYGDNWAHQVALEPDGGGGGGGPCAAVRSLLGVGCK